MAEGHDTRRESTKVIAPIEESHDAANIGQIGLKLRQGLGGNGGGSNGLSLNICHSLSIRFHSLAEGHDTLCKLAEVISSREEFHDPADLRQSSLEFCQRLGRDSGRLDSVGIDAGHSFAIGLHGLTEGDNALRELAEVVPAGKELHDTAHIGKRCLQLGQCLGRHSRGGHRPGVNAGNGVAIGFHGLAKGENPVSKCAKVIPTGKELHHAAHAGKGRLECGEGLSRGHRGGYCPCIHSGHCIGISLHTLSKGEQAIRKGFQIVSASEEVHHAADIGQRAL